MSKQIEFEGQIHEFPDDFTDEDIAAALSGAEPAMTTGATIQSYNPSMPQRAFDAVQSMAGIPGVLVGAAKQGMNVVSQGGDILRAGWNMLAPDSMDVDRPYQQAGDIPATNEWQQLGQRGMQAAELAAGAKGLTRVPGVMARGLGISKARAAQNINTATEAARGVSLNPDAPREAGQAVMGLRAAGGSTPRAAVLLMKRLEDTSKPLTFEEARNFYSNLSRLSANEYGRMNPKMQREVGAMTRALHEALTEAAGTVGKGQEYASGIREYARASKAGSLAKKGAGLATAGFTANYILNKISNALAQSGRP